MLVNQLYGLLTEASKQVLGESAIAVTDTASFLSLGKEILSTDETVDAFYSTLADIIGSVYLTYKELAPDDFSDIERKPLDFGAAINKISVSKIAGTVQNSSWKTTGGNDVYVQDTTSLVSEIFSVRGTFEIEPKVIYDFQLKSGLRDEATMMALVDLIFTDMHNAMTLQKNILQHDTMCTGIAIAASTETEKHTCINLLHEYNETFSKSLDAETAIYDKDFLKYAGSRIKTVMNKVKDPSVFYNAAGDQKWTAPDELRVRVLAEFAEKTKTYLESDTFNRELVALPGYKEVNFWQAQGTTGAFKDCSAVKISNGESLDEDLNYVIAYVFDKEAIATMTEFERIKSEYKPRQEHTEYYAKFDYGAYASTHENGIVFYMDDYYKIPKTESAPADWATAAQTDYYIKTAGEYTLNDSATYSATTQYYKAS